MAQINVNSIGCVVNQALMDLNLPFSPNFERYLHFAIKGFREMNLLGLAPTVKSVQLPVNQNTNTVQLPEDFVDYLRIGLCCNGTMINLVLNDEICLNDQYPQACDCTGEQLQNDISTLCNIFNANNGNCSDCNQYGAVWYWPTYGAYYPNFGIVNYGIGPGTYKGGYRLNREMNIIQFDSCVNAQSITLEYKSNGIKPDGNVVISEEMIPALNAYIHYQRCTFSQDPMDKQQARSFKSEFVTLMDDLSHRQNALTKETYLDVIRRFSFMGVKG